MACNRAGGTRAHTPNTTSVTLTEETEAVVGSELVLDRYRLGARLGAGGFGAVHEAIDERLDRWVAVKVIHSDGGATPDRARREAVAAARLDHPGIVSVFDAGEDETSRYLVSELVDGRTLAQLMAAQELSDRDVLRIGLALCDALEHAHERGVVHRDVKPQNVLVPDKPKTWRGVAKLADFGVAMLAGDEPLTVTGDVVGTLAYMAPEQAAGKKVDERADLYAVALVLYEALAGANPKKGLTPADTARRVGNAVPALQRNRKDLPPELCAAIDRALKIAPFERGTLEELADALEEALPDVSDDGGTVVHHPLEQPTLLPPVPRGTPRIAHAVMTGVMVAGALQYLGPTTNVPAPLAGAAAGLLVLLAPRFGWVMAAFGTIVSLAVGPALFGTQSGIAAVGSATLAACALLPIPILLASVPMAWSAPALAPLLGALGLAGVYPALAGRASRVVERAALGALGAWWLILAEPLAAQALFIGPAPDATTGTAVQGALSISAETLSDTVTAGLPLLLAVWAIAAAVLPWIVRGRSLALDVVVATSWSACLAASTAALARWLELPEPRGLVAGAIVAGVVAVIVHPRRYFKYGE